MQLLMKNDDFVLSRFSLLVSRHSFLVSTGPMADWRMATVAICGPLGTGKGVGGGEMGGGMGIPGSVRYLDTARGWVRWVIRWVRFILILSGTT